MNIRVKVDTGNAAFADNADELRDCLQAAVERIADGSREGTITDTNGNTVGEYKVTGK